MIGVYKKETLMDDLVRVLGLKYLTFFQEIKDKI